MNHDSEFSNDDTGRLILESILGTILESILETFVCYLCVTFVLPYYAHSTLHVSQKDAKIAPKWKPKASQEKQ